MGELVKAYYRPRIQIPVNVVLNDPGAWAWYCLPKDGVSALSRLLDYGRREITYIGEVINDSVFKTPTDAQMSEILDLIDSTGAALMDGCGTDEIVSVIETQNAILQAMTDCVCAINAWQQAQASSLPPTQGYVDEQLVTYKAPEDSWITPAAPGTDAVKCEYAQSWYLWVFQAYTETLLPYANSTADSITTAIVATATFAGLASFIGIPIAILTTLVTVLINWAIDGSIANFTNWLYAIKDEMVCVYYNNLPDYAAAAAAAAALIDSQIDISPLDKTLAKTLFASEWHGRWIVDDQVTNGTWDTYFVPGQCDTCIIVPSGCYSLAPCTPSDWSDPAAINCDDGYPRITGGIGEWEKEAPVCPENGIMRVAWVPWNGTGFGTARLYLGGTRVSDDTQYIEYATPPRTVGTLVVETFPLSSQLWNQAFRFTAQPVAFSGALVYWCIDAP